MLVSPIMPLPSWFYTDLLTTESKDVSRIAWALMQKSLELGEKEIPASFKDIEMWTGLVPDRISDSLKVLREKGYLIRVQEGKINATTGKRVKAVYKVNWDYKEKGVETRIRQVYKHITANYDVATAAPNGGEMDCTDAQVDANIASLVPKPKTGEKVRVGRFGDEKEGQKWFTVGYGAFHQKVADGPWGVVSRKLAAGQFDELTSRDLLSYFEMKYAKKYNIPYIPVMGKDLNILNKLRSAISNKEILRMIRWLLESGQKEFKTVTIGLMGTGFANKINTAACEWARTSAQIRSMK
jgi:DNA-binding transcriptional ArsR family regulator